MKSMYEWAKKEVELACKRENPNIKLDENGMPTEFDYGCSCYGSALKAYKSLLEDNHSGMSIMITEGILNRLIEGKCLTPIEDTEDVWHLLEEEEGHKEYQCNRMSSLFKDVYEDGTVKYHDVDRQVEIDEKNKAWHSGAVSRLIDGMFPIKMPYFPSDNPYKVYKEDFLFDASNGDYDTWALLYIETPEGEKIELNEYWCEKDGKVYQITKEEYEDRKRNKVK